MDSPWSRLRSSGMALVVLIGIAVIPAVYAAVLTSANFDPPGNLDRVPAAIVNSDRPVRSAAEGGEEIWLGEQLTNEMLEDGGENSSFDWRLMADADARAALEDGEIYVLPTIPPDFSADAISTASDDPSAATAGILTITTNDSTNLVVGNIAANVAAEVSAGLREKLSKEYLSGIYVALNTIGDSVTLAATGATDLHEGEVLAADGSSALVVGLSDLVAGADDLKSGAAELASNTSTLSAGAHELASGAAASRDGTTQLSGALDRLADGTRGLPDQLSDLTLGASQVADGTVAAAGGAENLATAITDFQTGSSGLSAGVAQALTGAQTLQGGASALAEQVPALAAGASGVSEGLAGLLAQYDQLDDVQRIAMLSQLAAGAEDVAAGTDQVGAAVSDLATGATTLVGSVETQSGLAYLAVGAEEAAGAAGLLADGADTLTANLDTLSAGAAQVSDGVGTLSTGLGTLAAGISGAATASSTLADGSARVASGADTLAAGTSQFEGGTSALVTGATKLADGTGNAANAAGTLSDSLGVLSEGGGELADSLAEGAANIPSYNTAEREHLSAVAAAPVEVVTERAHEVPTYGYGLAPYFASLALWVGAIALYLMRPALNPTLLAERRPAWLITLRSLVPGAVMAVVQSAGVVLALLALGIQPAEMAPLIGLATLSSLTFVAINQAFIALFDAPGRFLALLMIVLQLASAGGMYPVETAPALFRVLHGWLPLTATVDGLRSLIAGGTAGLDAAVPILLAWLAVGILGTFLAAGVRRHKQSMSPDLVLTD